MGSQPPGEPLSTVGDLRRLLEGSGLPDNAEVHLLLDDAPRQPPRRVDAVTWAPARHRGQPVFVVHAAPERRKRQRLQDVTEDEARAILKEGGFELLKYGGSASATSLLRCTYCGEERHRSVSAVHGGQVCKHFAAPLPPVTPEEAVELMRGAGYEPLEPYPGKAGAIWRARCLVCGAERRLALSDARRGVRECKHGRGTYTRTTAAEAEAEMRAAGYEPLEPYPGKVVARWRARCLVCGAIRHPYLSRVRSGARCMHSARGRRTLTEGSVS